VLSKRGSALVEERSNMMFVKDTPSRLDDVRAMIAKVDVAARQVMIEARIVEAGDSFAKNLGIRLAGGKQDPDGAVRPGDHDGEQLKAKGQRQSRTGRHAGQPASDATNRDAGTAEFPALQQRPDAVSERRNLGARSRWPWQGDLQPTRDDRQPGRGDHRAGRRDSLSAGDQFRCDQRLLPESQPVIESEATDHPGWQDHHDPGRQQGHPEHPLSTGAGVAIDTKHVKTEVLVENGGTVVIGGIYTQEKRNNTTAHPVLR
jgi:type IV pilus assembly protein PilQ